MRDATLSWRIVAATSSAGTLRYACRTFSHTQRRPRKYDVPESFTDWIHRCARYRPRGIVADFLRGLSVVGLARKYGRTRAQIERTLRRAM